MVEIFNTNTADYTARIIFHVSAIPLLAHEKALMHDQLEKVTNALGV